MHWTERAKAVVRIGKELRNRGWTLHGFVEDKSDPRTDTYSPASWDGVATHPKLGNTVVCVDVGHNAFSGDDGWPEYQATPHRKTWHVERNGEILKAGVGLGPCAKVGWEAEVEKVVDHIELVAYGAGRKPSTSGTSTDTGDYTVTIEHDRDWTWVLFSDKPPANVRDQLSNMGACWSKKRDGWYFRRDVSDDELAWLSLTDDGDTAEAEAQMTPLELARHLWETHRPQKEGEEQRMAYDYVPNWLAPHIPKLYSQDGERDPVVWLKLFLPEGRWTFYVTEYSEVAPDETPDLFFGYMASPLGEMYDELGYVTLEQIEEIRGPHLGSRIERDLWWTPKPLSEVKAALNPPPSSETEKRAPGTQTSEVEDIVARVEEIKAREGEPCTVVTDENDEIVHVITPAWLYRQWHTLLGERGEIDDADADTFAREMFLEGAQSSSASAPEFRRFCRCATQGALLGRNPVWKETYRDGGDFGFGFGYPSPIGWKPYIGTKPTAPQFDVGDSVRITWRSEDEVHTVYIREWREYHSRWYYKVDGKWQSEDDLVAAKDANANEDANDAEKSATEPETPTLLPEGWATEDIQALLDALAEGPILLSEKDLGIPTIHDPGFRDNGDGKVRHLGYGMFEIQTPDYTLRFDAGGAMRRTPSGRSWTPLRVVEGEYDGYPFEDVRAKLERYLEAQEENDEADEERVRNLLYDENGQLRPIEDIEDEADEIFAGHYPGQKNGPDKVFVSPDGGTSEEILQKAESALRSIGSLDAVSLSTSNAKSKQGQPVATRVNVPQKAIGLHAARFANRFTTPENNQELYRRIYDMFLAAFSDETDGELYQEGDKVWWEDDDGNIQGGIVDYVDCDGKEITVKHDTMMTYAGGVPIGRIERFAADDLNFGPVPEEHLGTFFDLEIGEAVWWDREETVVLATVEEFCYLGDKPCVILRRKSGVVNREGTDVSFEGAFDFNLATYQRIDVQRTSPPDDTIVIEAGDSVTIAQDCTVPACNVYSPKGNRCRSDRKINAGDVFELVRFATSTGMATHGMTCAAIRDKDGYEYHVFIERLALRPEQLLSEETKETAEQTDIEETNTEATKAEGVEDDAKVETAETADENESENEAIALPFQAVELPDPILDLDQGVTIRQMMALIEESYVYSDFSEGVAANQGKRYIRFTVDAARIDSAVKFEGQLYDSASTGPQRYDGRLDELVEWEARPFALLPAQKVQNLLDEANAAREQYPELATKADQMYRQVMTAYDLAAHYEQERLLRVWLSLHDLQTSGKNFRPRIVGRHIEEALRAAFGEVSRWEDILDSSDGAVDEITAEADESDAEADDEISVETKLRKKRNLPDDVPLAIKVDLGRTHGWAEAEVTRVKGRWLYYAIRNGSGNGTRKRKGKVQIIGRDILWQPSVVPADEAMVGGVQ